MTDPGIQATFRLTTRDGFTSTRTPDYSCPPHIIATLAEGKRLVPPAELELPDIYTMSVLKGIQWRTGSFYADTRIEGCQARELAAIGEQLLRLNAEEAIEPPLSYVEKHSIEHLVQLVGEVAMQDVAEQ